jgi:hypothetical protein
LRAQIESFPELHPGSSSLRNTPIAGVLLTNADLDHVLGLFALREGDTLNIYATDAVRQTLTRPIGLQAVLHAFSGVNWHLPPASGFAPLPACEQSTDAVNPRTAARNRGRQAGEASVRESRLASAEVTKGTEGTEGTQGATPSHRPMVMSAIRMPFTQHATRNTLRYRAIILPGSAPPFAKEGSLGGGHCVAYQFLDERTGGRLLVAPDVARITEPLREAVKDSEAVIFDGTFWSAGELARVKRGAVAAGKMGHVPIQNGSLNLLEKSAARHKIYIHINNTNPILAGRSPQRSKVEAAGILVGQDGYAFEV